MNCVLFDWKLFNEIEAIWTSRKQNIFNIHQGEKYVFNPSFGQKNGR